MTDELEEIDIGTVKLVPSDIEIPVHDFPVLTKRSLCAETPENLSLLNRIDTIQVITDIIDNVETNPQEVCHTIEQTLEDLKAAYNSTDVTDCSQDLFTESVEVIDNISELKLRLSEVLVRFDTSPEHYTKEDYQVLIKLLYASLLYVYDIIGSAYRVVWRKLE